jgi:hypothetical protein
VSTNVRGVFQDGGSLPSHYQPAKLTPRDREIISVLRGSKVASMQLAIAFGQPQYHLRHLASGGVTQVTFLLGNFSGRWRVALYVASEQSGRPQGSTRLEQHCHHCISVR